MDQDKWTVADQGVDKIADKLDQLLDSEAVADIKKLLGELEVKLGGRFGVSLSCVLDIFDRDTELERENVLRVLDTGFSTNEGSVYRT